MYKLRTNEGVKYVRSTESRLTAAMWKYIREKRKAGVPLADIVFTWSRLHFTTI